MTIIVAAVAAAHLRTMIYGRQLNPSEAIWLNDRFTATRIDDDDDDGGGGKVR